MLQNKKIFLSLIIIFNMYAHEFNKEQLINHVRQSIYNAEIGTSRLSPEILAIEGMSSNKVRHVLNNLASLPNASYFEVGVWRGSTFISALYNNENTLLSAIAMDNWSEFQSPKDIFTKNINTFLTKNSFKFYDQNCFTVNKKTIFTHPVNVYFYDGNHGVESHKRAFTYFNDIFSNTFIAIVDDWNHEPARIGTRQAFNELHYIIHYEIELPARFNGDIENWWNGLYIAVISKK